MEKITRGSQQNHFQKVRKTEEQKILQVKFECPRFPANSNYINEAPEVMLKHAETRMALLAQSDDYLKCFWNSIEEQVSVKNCKTSLKPSLKINVYSVGETGGKTTSERSSKAVQEKIYKHW